jgi:hypothetical protein
MEQPLGLALLLKTPKGTRRFEPAAQAAGFSFAQERWMRKLLLFLTAATALVTAAALAPSHAMTAVTASRLQAARADLSLMSEAAYVCHHRVRTSRRVCWWRPGPYNWRWRPWKRWRERRS